MKKGIENPIRENIENLTDRWTSLPYSYVSLETLSTRIFFFRQYHREEGSIKGNN